MKRIVDQLAKVSGGEWKAVRDGFSWYWKCTDGREVRSYSESILTFDGHSDSEFDTVYLDCHGHRVGCNGVIYRGAL